MTLINPNDPLNNTPDRTRELFETFVQTASGHTADSVVGAAANLLVNAIRQAHSTQRGALNSFDEMSAKIRAFLAEHYDGIGKRRNVFPFHQTVEMPHLDFRNSKITHG